MTLGSGMQYKGYKGYADIRGGSLEMGRQMTVG